jgi:hypothetical protein
MSICPYIGVESGTQLEPELSRLIGSARLRDEGMAISWPWLACDEWDAGEGWDGSGFCLDVSALSAFIGTRDIPHFGQSPGAFAITSGCMEQVYFRETGSALLAVALKIATRASISKKNLFIVVS